MLWPGRIAHELHEEPSKVGLANIKYFSIPVVARIGVEVVLGSYIMPNRSEI